MLKKKSFFSFILLLSACLIFLIIQGCMSDPVKTKAEKEDNPIAETNASLRATDSLRFKKPSIEWERNMSEGQDFYTPEFITASNKLLDKYLTELRTAKDTSDVWKAVESVVKDFDKLIAGNDDFIATTEREELAAFIQMAARHYGLHYNGDITEKWRMEW